MHLDIYINNNCTLFCKYSCFCWFLSSPFGLRKSFADMYDMFYLDFISEDKEDMISRRLLY